MSRLGATDRFIATPFVIEAMIEAGARRGCSRWPCVFALPAGVRARRWSPSRSCRWPGSRAFVGAAIALAWLAAVAGARRGCCARSGRDAPASRAGAAAALAAARCRSPRRGAGQPRERAKRARARGDPAAGAREPRGRRSGSRARRRRRSASCAAPSASSTPRASGCARSSAGASSSTSSSSRRASTSSAACSRCSSSSATSCARRLRNLYKYGAGARARVPAVAALVRPAADALGLPGDGRRAGPHAARGRAGARRTWSRRNQQRLEGNLDRDRAQRAAQTHRENQPARAAAHASARPR